MRTGGREYRCYVLVEETVLKTRDDIQYWLGLALEFNQRAKATRN